MPTSGAYLLRWANDENDRGFLLKTETSNFLPKLYFLHQLCSLEQLHTDFWVLFFVFVYEGLLTFLGFLFDAFFATTFLEAGRFLLFETGSFLIALDFLVVFRLAIIALPFTCSILFIDDDVNRYP
jgi:hypothetical protein